MQYCYDLILMKIENYLKCSQHMFKHKSQFYGIILFIFITFKIPNIIATLTILNFGIKTFL